jgi:hypothetical protein
MADSSLKPAGPAFRYWNYLGIESLRASGNFAVLRCRKMRSAEGEEL